MSAIPVVLKPEPSTTESRTTKVEVGTFKIYITVAFYSDGKPSRLNVKGQKEGSTLGGMLRVFSALVTLAFQYGAPWPKIYDTLRMQRFEPNAHNYTSIADAVAIEVDRMILEYRKEKEPG